MIFGCRNGARLPWTVAGAGLNDSAQVSSNSAVNTQRIIFPPEDQPPSKPQLERKLNHARQGAGRVDLPVLLAVDVGVGQREVRGPRNSLRLPSVPFFFIRSLVVSHAARPWGRRP